MTDGMRCGGNQGTMDLLVVERMQDESSDVVHVHPRDPLATGANGSTQSPLKQRQQASKESAFAAEDQPIAQDHHAHPELSRRQSRWLPLRGDGSQKSPSQRGRFVHFGLAGVSGVFHRRGGDEAAYGPVCLTKPSNNRPDSADARRDQVPLAPSSPALCKDGLAHQIDHSIGSRQWSYRIAGRPRAHLHIWRCSQLLGGAYERNNAIPTRKELGHQVAAHHPVRPRDRNGVCHTRSSGSWARARKPARYKRAISSRICSARETSPARRRVMNKTTSP